tara:strand:+ start:472 stop:1428 length:957 start_codon:yes stop_codon:yes gene_type:complete
MAYLTQSLNAVVSNEFFRNPIYPGIADAIQEAASFYEFVPFTAIKGSSIGVQENSDQNLTAFVADGGDLDTGNSINQLTTAFRNYNIKSIAGLANIGTVSNAGASANGVDLMAVAIQAKARDIARKVYKQVVRGTDNGDASGFRGLDDFYADADGELHGKNELTPSAGGDDIADVLDQLLNSITAADPEFIMMNGTILNKFTSRMRASGAGFNYVTTPVTNRNVLSYQGVPIFRNDHITVHTTDKHEIYAGCFEKGGNTGITMLYPEGTPAGLEVVDLGESEKYLGRVTRVAQHTALAVMNSEGLAKMTVDLSDNASL